MRFHESFSSHSSINRRIIIKEPISRVVEALMIEVSIKNAKRMIKSVYPKRKSYRTDILRLNDSHGF